MTTVARSLGSARSSARTGPGIDRMSISDVSTLARRQASPARVQRNALPDHRDRARGGPPNDHGPRNHRRPCAHQGVHPARHDARCLRRSGLGPIPSNRGHDDPNHVYRHATTPGQRAHPGPPDRDPRAGSCWDHYCDGTRTNHVHVHLRDHRGRGSHHGDHPSATTSPSAIACRTDALTPVPVTPGGTAAAVIVAPS